MSNESTPQAYPCEYCEGTGKIYGKECKECRGSGILAKDDKAIYYIGVDEKDNMSIVDIKEILDPSLKKEYENYQTQMNEVRESKENKLEKEIKPKDISTNNKSDKIENNTQNNSSKNKPLFSFKLLLTAFLILLLLIATIVSFSMNQQIFKVIFILDILIVGLLLLRLFFKDNSKKIFDKLTSTLREPDDLIKFIEEKRNN